MFTVNGVKLLFRASVYVAGLLTRNILQVHVNIGDIVILLIMLTSVCGTVA